MLNVEFLVSIWYNTCCNIKNLCFATFCIYVSRTILTYSCHCFPKQHLGTNCRICKEGTEFYTVMYINMLEGHCWHFCALSQFW